MGGGEDRTLTAPGVHEVRADADMHVGVAESALVRLGVPEYVARILACTPSLRMSWFGAVGLVLGLSILASNNQRGLPLFLVLAPLLPIAGVAAAYGPGMDPGHELSRAAPMSNFKLVLWRSAAVLATTTAIAGVAGVWFSREGYTTAAWVLPSLAVTVVALALGTFIEPWRAAAIVAFVWIAGVVATTNVATSTTTVFRGPAQATYAVLATVASVVVVRRRDRFEIEQGRIRRRIVVAADEERRRLERNLHDGAQQQLVGIALKVRLAKAMLTRDPAQTGQILEQLESEVADALASLRELARGMYPPLLAERGLVAALEAHAGRYGLPVTVDARGIARYAPEVEATVYFCCLEALQNVSKYARASEVQIRLEELGGELSFAVIDDGAGFEPGRTARGAGLRNMEERLKAYGGRLDVVSRTGGGTRILGRMRPEATAD